MMRLAWIPLVAVAVAVAFAIPPGAGAHHVEPVLTVTKAPVDGGTVRGNGIDCGTDCTESFEHTVICESDLGFDNCYDDFGGALLIATPSPGHAFNGWTDCPSEQYGECSASLQGEDLTVTARFRTAACSDGLDNDTDLLVDLADPECTSISDDSEVIGPVPLDPLTPPPLTVTPASIGATRDTTPTVEFSSTELGVTYNCLVIALRNDGGLAYYVEIVIGCTSPYTTPELEDGPYRMMVAAINAPQRAVSEINRPLTVDTTAPDTSITASPAGTTRSTVASFQFTAAEPSAVFECRMDSDAWAPCTSPKEYADLAQGGHAFEVAATDAAGNRELTPAARAWAVDSIAPAITGVSPAASATGVAGTSEVLASFSEEMGATTVTATAVRLVRKGSSTPVAAIVTYDPVARRARLDPTSTLQRGTTYTATVTAGVEDLAGNALAASRSWSFTTSR